MVFYSDNFGPEVGGKNDKHQPHAIYPDVGFSVPAVCIEHNLVQAFAIKDKRKIWKN